MIAKKDKYRRYATAIILAFIPTAAAAVVHQSHQHQSTVPSYRRGSGCDVYDNADCSPERYRYPSPTREPQNSSSGRNVLLYDAYEPREPYDPDPRESRPAVRQPYPHSHQHGHPARQPPSTQSAQFHQPRAYPAYADYLSTNQQYTKNEQDFPEQVIPSKLGARAEQPLATGPKPASSHRYAAAHCPYDHPIQVDLKCANNYNWNAGKYVRDECGSGIVTTPCGSRDTRANWCKTPLSIYQSSICELGRKLLCGEIRIPPRIMGPPPCNVCEDILPPCHGYYRKYEKLPPCEEQYVKMAKGRRMYRDKVQRYWEPCDLPQAGRDEDIRNYSGQNAYLAMKINTRADEGNLDM